jgi:hypothetical protein
MNGNVQSLINDLFIKKSRYLDISEWSPKDESEDFVWVDGQWLRRYLKYAKYAMKRYVFLPMPREENG